MFPPYTVTSKRSHMFLTNMVDTSELSSWYFVSEITYVSRPNPQTLIDFFSYFCDLLIRNFDVKGEISYLALQSVQIVEKYGGCTGLNLSTAFSKKYDVIKIFH